MSPDEMARRLGRHRSTIFRELRRNHFHDSEVPTLSGYWGIVAQGLSDGRRTRQRKLVRGMRFESKEAPDPICGPCIMGKQTRKAVLRGPGERATRPLELVHTDLKVLCRSHPGRGRTSTGSPS